MLGMENVKGSGKVRAVSYLLYITLQHVSAFFDKPSLDNVQYLKKDCHLQHNKFLTI